MGEVRRVDDGLAIDQATADLLEIGLGDSVVAVPR